MPRSAPLLGASLALVAFLSSAPSAHGEEANRLAPNAIYAEVGGAGLSDSLNYERLFGDRVALRAGLGATYAGNDAAFPATGGAHGPFFSLPLTLSYLGLRAHEYALEVGGGVTIADLNLGISRVASVYTMRGGVEPYGVAFVGCRVQPEGGARFQLRIGAMALIGNGFSFSGGDPSFADAERFGIIPWAYLSAGVAF